MTTVYLASQYARREELTKYRDSLEAIGHRVNSRWLDGTHSIPNFEGLPGEEFPPQGEQFALIDFHDVRNSDVLICFTEPRLMQPTSGGRHVEFGLALGLGKNVAIVGPYENVFHRLPNLQHFDEWGEEVLRFVSGCEPRPVGLRLAVQDYAMAMENKLRANDWRPGMVTMQLGEIKIRLLRESVELLDALLNGKSNAQIVRETVDVANFGSFLHSGRDIRGFPNLQEPESLLDLAKKVWPDYDQYPVPGA